MQEKKPKNASNIWDFDTERLVRGLGHFFPPFIIIKETEWKPSIDIFEASGEIIVKAELAGVKQEDLRVEVVGHTLIIIGARDDTSSEQREVAHQVEIDYGKFRRQLELPCDVDANKANASMQNGFLTLILPKAENDNKAINIPIE